MYLQAQRAILAATQFVIELNKAVKENADMNPIYEKMKELEAFLQPLLSRSESWLLASTTTSPVDPTEEVVARSLRCMASIKLNSARIKVHRYCAFFDIPVFSRKHCDLKSLSAADNGDEPRRWPTCSCSTFANAFPGSVPGSATTPTTGSASASATSAGLSPSSDGTTGGYGQGMSAAAGAAAGAGALATMTSTSTSTSAASTSTSTPGAVQQPQPQLQLQPPPPPTNFPFSSHQSARICLKSALDIARAFDELPFPNPLGAPPQPQGPPVFLGPASAIACPRTMPSFACCAMQCAYALLMVHQKTKTMYPYPDAAAAESMGLGPAGGAGPGGPGGPGPGPGAQQRLVVVSGLVGRLQQGLTSIYATLSNYATAFEALGGMRGEWAPLCLVPCAVRGRSGGREMRTKVLRADFRQIKSGARSRTRRLLRYRGGLFVCNGLERHRQVVCYGDLGGT